MRFGSLALRLTEHDEVPVSAAFVCYANRTQPNDYSAERCDKGPLLWRGELPGVFVYREMVQTAPEDETELTTEHEHPRRGEVDITFTFDHEGELSKRAKESLRSAMTAMMSLANLRLGDLQRAREKYAAGETVSDDDLLGDDRGGGKTH